MVSKRISAVCMLLILVAFSALSFVRAYMLGIPFPAGEGAIIPRTEEFLLKALPLSRTLESASLRLRYLLGAREENGVFISKERLIENIPLPDYKAVQKNMDAILDFTARQDATTYAMLIPTPSAVLQSETPPFADVDIYNQKQFIENVYLNFAGKLSCVDVYSTLFQHSGQYIYYNTEPLLAPQGGFLVYQVLSRRMGGAPYPLSRFDIAYPGVRFYGSLCERVEYKPVQPDSIALYTYASSPKEFTVTHLGEHPKEYNTLYPTHLLALPQPLDVYFGGFAPVMDIVQKRRSKNGLLVFCDRQMLSVLPFLACDFQRITTVDLSRATPQQLSGLDLEGYASILFAYSVDTFMHSDTPSRVGLY